MFTNDLLSLKHEIHDITGIVAAPTLEHEDAPWFVIKDDCTTIFLKKNPPPPRK